MEIVITDGYTLNPGDLSWQTFHSLGTVKYYDRLPVNDITECCKNATVIITNKTPINRQTIEAAPNLKLIAVTATGFNIIDTITAREKGVDVCNVPEYGTDSVAQHCLALILELTNHVGSQAASVKAGDWVNAIDWTYVPSPLIELKNKTLGIIGFGRIGQRTAELAKAFGMKVIYNGGRSTVDWAQAVSLQEVFEKSDFISLHCPLKPANTGFVNKELLSKMKPTAYLINTSRGQLINEQDLADALNNKVLAGAALDVLSQEPPIPNNPLLRAAKCLITPHNAWISFEARSRLIATTFENITAALNGHPQNVVN